ncbi:MAG: hypothetical protein FWG63_04765 [Defluviitaleaceae bacterium]|nr:hypothetical protein [Defluviitaleaceae bacterium]
MTTNEHFSMLIHNMNTIANEQIKRYNEATAVAMDAQDKIAKLQNWIEDLQQINSEYIDVFYDVDSGTLNQHKQNEIPEQTKTLKQAKTGNITLVLFDETYNIDNHTELVESLCEALILKEPYKFAKLSTFSNTGISLDKKQIAEPYSKLSNGMFVSIGNPEKPSNTNEASDTSDIYDIEVRCQFILEKCGYSTGEMEIHQVEGA